MKRLNGCVLVLAISLLAGAGRALAAEEAVPTTAAAVDPAEAKYTAAIEKRATEVLALLKLEDADKAAKVHDLLINQYRALRDWEASNTAKLKDKSLPAEEKAKVLVTRQPLHDQFVSQLSALLTPEQVEQVKDKLTYNKVKVTYSAYCEFLPQMTDAQKAQVLDYLKQAREEAIDGGSAEEKTAIFGRYKGKINNYLATQKLDLKKGEQEFRERIKAARTASTQPSAK